MKKYILKATVALCALASVSSCSLDEYNPNEITGDETLATFAGLRGIQAQCYSPIYGQLYTVFDFMSMAECGTDTWWAANNKTNTEQMFYYEGLTSSTNKGWDKAFTQMYSALGNCNTVISRAENVTDGNADALKTLVAEAHFLRGYYHLLLTTYYGPITLVLEDPAGKAKLAPTRNTLSEIYSSIISDMKYAIDNLPVTPLDGNRARASKKAAKGMLCRAYIQGAGQGLSENGVSYWERAKEEAEDFITNMSSYGADFYQDVDDLWADTNNRNNKEALFTAAGVDGGAVDVDTYSYGNSFANKLFTYCYWNQESMSILSSISDAKTDPLYGRCNNNLMAPSYYLLHCFTPAWDKRWENSFQTAFFSFSQQVSGEKPYAASAMSIAKKTTAVTYFGKFGMDPSTGGKSIYPYVDLQTYEFDNSIGGKQYPAKVWPKGDHSGDPSKLQEVKKIYSIPYPLAADDDRFFLYMYPAWDDEYKGGFDKIGRMHCSVSIDDLMQKNPEYPVSNNEPNSYVMNLAEFNANDKSITTADIYKVWPSLNKFMWNYKGVYYGGNLQVRNGDVAVMRMAEVYLIAAEAEQHLGHGEEAAKYLNVLRERAKRPGYMGDVKIKSATEDDIFDEYARELCGEFQRWALLQRHQAFESRLKRYNTRAAMSYKPRNIWRPISATFLQQIDNKEEYGDNGYETTAKSGLDGFLQ